MPRSFIARRVLPKLGPNRSVRATSLQKRDGPRIFNAKRLVKESQSEYWRKDDQKAQLKNTLIKKYQDDGSWRTKVSPDVAEFIDDMEAQGTKMLPEEQYALLADPVKFFSRPQNVPNNMRTQVYFPHFMITLSRNRHKGSPYNVEFRTPLWFTKLDMKHYLKEAYKVDVVHVRSVVKGGGYKRHKSTSMYSRGRPYRARRVKIMLVQLVEPFAWPVKDTGFNAEVFEFARKIDEANIDENLQLMDPLKVKVDYKRRQTIAEQAQELLAGRRKWQPTWETLPQARRELTGKQDPLSTSN